MNEKQSAHAQVELASSFYVVAISPEGDVFVSYANSGRPVEILAMVAMLRLRADELEEEARDL